MNSHTLIKKLANTGRVFLRSVSDTKTEVLFGSDPERSLSWARSAEEDYRNSFKKYEESSEIVSTLTQSLIYDVIMTYGEIRLRFLDRLNNQLNSNPYAR
jgi:hypothetical protein